MKCTPSAQKYTYCLPASDRLLQASYSACQTSLSRMTVVAERPGASGPSRAFRASLKSPVLMPLRYSQGISSSMLLVRRRYGGRIGRGERLPLVGGPAVTDPGLLDLDGPDAGLDGPLGEVAVADDLATSRRRP